MTDKSLKKYKEWEDASTKAALWRMAFKKVKKDFPEDHVLYKHAKAELTKSRTHLDKLQSKW